jgi:uncharacterized protein (TIRG00374 family)
MKKWLTSILVVAVTALLLGYALWNVNLTLLSEVLAGADYRYVAPFLLTLTLFYTLKAWRWVMILEPLGRYTIYQVTPAMMIGFAANNVLPGHLGEIVRSVWFARRYRQRISPMLVSQMVERILDVMAILLLFLLVVPWIESAPQALLVSVWLVGAIVAAVCVLIYAMVAAPQRVIHLWHVLGAKLPAYIRSRGDAPLRDILQTLTSVRSPGRLLLLVINSLIQWSLMGVCVWLSMAAMGVSIGPAVTILVLTATAVAVTIPNAPGYVGALQAAFVFALQPFGVPSESAFAGSVFYLVGNWVPTTCVGGLFMLAARLRH